MRAQHASGESAKQARKAISNDGIKRLTATPQATAEMPRQQSDADGVVRRMTAAVGFPTLRLIRAAIGPHTLDGLAPGHWRDVDSAL